MATTGEQIEAAILGQLQTSNIDNSVSWAEENGFERKAVESVIKSLTSDETVTAISSTSVAFKLTPAGDAVLASGSPEFHILVTVAERAAAGNPVSAKDKVRQEIEGWT